MGQRIAALALEHNNPPVAVTGAIEAKGHPAVGKRLGELIGIDGATLVITDDVRTAIQHGDVLIEFTNPEATMEHVRVIRELKKPMVIGTTGLIDVDRTIIEEVARHTPILLSPNMSVGVNLLFELVRLSAEQLKRGYTVEIEETHHAGKKDTPSGTAKKLQEIISQITQESVPCLPHRTGEVVGEHTVTFTGQFERVTLTHEALSRDVFALGALTAALFIARVQKPGLYDMSHVLQDAHR